MTEFFAYSFATCGVILALCVVVMIVSAVAGFGFGWDWGYPTYMVALIMFFLTCAVIVLGFVASALLHWLSGGTL